VWRRLKMRHDDIDRMLAGEENLVPSSGFVTSVMDAVQREASTPLPIPFPWKWALPGMAAGVFALVSFLIIMLAQSGRGSVTTPVPVASLVLITIVEAAKTVDAGWIALGLLMSYASVTLSMRLIEGRT
jgi:hypothetical protein